MPAGRKPKPDAVKRAQGNPGRRPIASDQPAAEPAGPSIDETLPAVGGIPQQLSREGKMVWKRIVPEISRLNFVKGTDREMLARYCESIAEFWKLTRDIRKNGHTYWTESNHGKLRRINPAFMAADRVERRLQSLEDRIGLSPQARQTLLAKMAGQVQAPPGGLFGEEKNGDVPDENSAAPGVAPGSAIGLLDPAKLH